MPRGNRTGPAGYGPMTGRGAGFCAGFSVPGCYNPVPGRFSGGGRGLGFYGYGRGRGYRRGFAPFFPGVAYPVEYYSVYDEQYSPEDEASILSQEAKYLKQELDTIKQRLEQLKLKKEDPDNE